MKKFRVRLSKTRNGFHSHRETFVGDNLEQCILKAGALNISGFTILRGCDTKRRIKMKDYQNALLNNKVHLLLA